MAEEQVEIDQLRKEMEEKDKELHRQKEVAKKREADAKQTVIQTMEDEFSCTICKELFFDATTLPCAHSFCEFCLRSWLKRKRTCPVCRRKVRVKAFRSVVLDSAIERIVDSMDDDTKERRRDLKRERDELIEREDTDDGSSSARRLIHRAQDDDNSQNDNERSSSEPEPSHRYRGSGYRRRSRSRSPRGRIGRIRHRPYINYRYTYTRPSDNQVSSSRAFQANQSSPLLYPTLPAFHNNQQSMYVPTSTQIFQPLLPSDFPNPFNEDIMHQNNGEQFRFNIENNQYGENSNQYVGGNHQYGRDNQVYVGDTQPYMVDNNHDIGENRQFIESSYNNSTHDILCFTCGSMDHVDSVCPQRYLQ